ncbi:cytoplasmic protein, partial [candidate division KSB1 bacterium]|nr:cytoplasmic protein [candidate division KSB1 bacterium]
MNLMNRRKFLKIAGIAGIASSSMIPFPILKAAEQQTKSALDLAVVTNADPAAMVRKAVDMLGGISKFVKKGNIVVVKPNIGWDRVPEQAATTNPDVV